MFTKEYVTTKSSKGNYIISFISEPEGQIQATVFHDSQTVHIYFKIKSGFSLANGERLITEKWLSEIFHFLDKNNQPRESVHLYDEGAF